MCIHRWLCETEDGRRRLVGTCAYCHESKLFLSYKGIQEALEAKENKSLLMDLHLRTPSPNGAKHVRMSIADEIRDSD